MILLVIQSHIVKILRLTCCIIHDGEGMAPQSSPLAWKIPWAEEPGRLQSMGSLSVGHD